MKCLGTTAVAAIRKLVKVFDDDIAVRCILFFSTLKYTRLRLSLWGDVNDDEKKHDNTTVQIQPAENAFQALELSDVMFVGRVIAAYARTSSR